MRKKKRLIINADGFGFTYGNNRAIFEVLRAGIVRSVSVNVNFPAVEEITKVSREFPDVSIAVHLNLSVGKPVCNPAEIPSLVDESGEFWYRKFTKKAFRGELDPAQIRKELHAQFKVLEDYGIKISHWDSHEDRHLCLPFFRAALEVAASHGVTKMRNHRRWLYADRANARIKGWLFHLTHPKRFGAWVYSLILMRYACVKGMKMADHFLCPGAYGMDKDKADTWKNIFVFPAGTSEITCHPGYPDETLLKYATMIDNRIGEAKVLQDHYLAQADREFGVELINFRQL